MKYKIKQIFILSMCINLYMQQQDATCTHTIDPDNTFIKTIQVTESPFTTENECLECILDNYFPIKEDYDNVQICSDGFPCSEQNRENYNFCV